MEKLKQLIEEGRQDNFYQWSAWKDMRAKVMRMDNYECQLCKAKGKHSKGEIVHHVKHLRDYPEYALSLYCGEERQLITVCKRCHEELHPESQRQFARVNEPLTEERWD